MLTHLLFLFIFCLFLHSYIYARLCGYTVMGFRRLFNRSEILRFAPCVILEGAKRPKNLQGARSRMTRGKRRFAGLRDVEVSNPKGVSARVEDRATAKRCWKRRPLHGRSKPLPYGYVHLVGADPVSARCIQPPRDPSLRALPVILEEAKRPKNLQGARSRMTRDKRRFAVVRNLYPIP